jgi:hypothetical protein
MSISIDTYDEVGENHPRNKQLPAKRLSIASMNVAYGQDNYPTKGPFPKSVEFTDGGEVYNSLGL